MMKYLRCIPFWWSFDTFGLVYKSEQNIDYIPWSLLKIPLKDKDELALYMWEIQLEDLNCKSDSIREVWELVSGFQYLTAEQREIIVFVAQHYITPIHNSLWLYFPKNLTDKIKKDTVEKIKLSDYSYQSPNLILSAWQEKVYQDIYDSGENKHLIYWITWSWKTQIYMKLIADTLAQWKQSLLLIPEIILTSQIGERLKKEFWDDVILLNSSVSAAKKSKYWMDIYHWNAKIIVGTRSTLFYPYNNLGLIIIDEEHDSSYISDSAPRYHTLDVAEKLSELYNVPLILWSWTPRTTTLYRGMKWEFKVSQLLEKYSD